MSKRKWQRLKLADLADPEKQKEILDLIGCPKGHSEADSSQKRPPEMPQAEH